MIELICSDCGRLQDYMESDTTDLNCCIICGGRMIFNVDKTAEEMKNITLATDDVLLDQMREDIKKNGHSCMWNIVEECGEYKVRLKYRKAFFQVGGIIPEKDLLEKREGKLYLLECVS